MKEYDLTRNDVDKLITGYADWIKEQKRNGWDVFYVNVMFDHLSGMRDALLQQMGRAIEGQFYRNLCRQLDRHPSRPSRHGLLPRMILFPDLPVYKKEKCALREVTLNGGFHYNGFVSVSPRARLNTGFEEHVSSNQEMYARYPIARVHVQEITRSPRRVVGYAAKTVKRQPDLYDDSIVLPSALSSKAQPPTPAQKGIKDLQARTNYSDELASVFAEETCFSPGSNAAYSSL